MKWDALRAPEPIFELKSILSTSVYGTDHREFEAQLKGHVEPHCHSLQDKFS